MTECMTDASGKSPDPLVTVVMACFNQAAYLRQAIESVLMQKTDFPVRLIITDDHSTQDGSAAIIREYAAKYPDRITALLNDENGRYLKNALRAMPLVKSEYFTLLDADDYWTDDRYLADAVAFLQAHADFTVYFRNVEWTDGAGGRGAQHAADEADFDMTFADAMNGNGVFPQTTGAVFRNVVYRNGIPPRIAAAVGTIHERAFDGDVFRFYLHLREGKAHFANKVAGVYRVAPGGVFSTMPAYRRQMIQAQCFVDYYDYFRTAKNHFRKLASDSARQSERNVPADGSAERDAEFVACRESVKRFCSADEEGFRKHVESARCSPCAPGNGLICYTYNDGRKEPGYYAPGVMNIGDYVQSLAARQFFDSIDEYVDRDQLGTYDGRPVNMIMNAWYRFWEKNRTFSDKINPLMVAVHVSNPDDLTEESFAYFKAREPIGCRDVRTAEFFEEHGISAYFSGCLTLTLGRTYRVPEGAARSGIYFVDYRLGEDDRIDGELRPLLNRFLRKRKAYFLSHYYPLSQNPQDGLRRAEALVKTYARAELVITPNIHCALPCLALGTPVVFVTPRFDGPRFSGLMEFFNHVGFDERGNFVSRVRADRHGQVVNGTAHEQYAKRLEELCQTFGRRTHAPSSLSDSPLALDLKRYEEAEDETGLFRRIYRKQRKGRRRTVTLLDRFRLVYEKRAGKGKR